MIPPLMASLTDSRPTTGGTYIASARISSSGPTPTWTVSSTLPSADITIPADRYELLYELPAD
ncbi:MULTISPECIES: hypothetical protein [unclassified Frankia]|uniref:hypothetical protein n=1 Tax=unclassified Frankia TaxID=2632575 RepID=UPI001EF57C65|nr:MULTISPECIES: hypothetical protein [unclassified Frankia]